MAKYQAEVLHGFIRTIPHVVIFESGNIIPDSNDVLTAIGVSRDQVTGVSMMLGAGNDRVLTADYRGHTLVVLVTAVKG